MRLHSGDSLGSGAADAASEAAHAHRMPCRLSGRPSKAHLSLRPQFNFPSSHPHSIRSRLPPLADIGRSAVGCVEPGAEAACLFYGTPNAPQKRVAFRREPAQIAKQSSARAKRSARKGARVSHAKRCADKGVANEGWDPKNRQPRSDRLLICRSMIQCPKETSGVRSGSRCRCRRSNNPCGGRSYRAVWPTNGPPD